MLANFRKRSASTESTAEEPFEKTLERLRLDILFVLDRRRSVKSGKSRFGLLGEAENLLIGAETLLPILPLGEMEMIDPCRAPWEGRGVHPGPPRLVFCGQRPQAGDARPPSLSMSSVIKAS